jgi:hypothetical protein
LYEANCQSAACTLTGLEVCPAASDGEVLFARPDRDLKLDNTLLDDSKPPLVKLCDFGFAKGFEPGQNLMTNIGYA